MNKIIFRAERMHGEVIEGYHFYDQIDEVSYIIMKDAPHTQHEIKGDTLEVTLDGVNWGKVNE